MIDDLVGFALAVILDVKAAQSAKVHRWVRWLRISISILFVGVIGAGVFITVKYS